MSARGRVTAFAAVVVVVLVAAAAFVLRDHQRYRSVVTAAPQEPTVAPAAYDGRPRLVFRNTEVGRDYGLVASVPLDDPTAPRAVTRLACDRVDATRTRVSCLQTKRGVVTGYRWLALDERLRPLDDEPLAGIPSRTRLSPDGRLVASTVFVSGHSYMQVGFSTATVVREVGGRSYGNLEAFRLVVDGRTVRPSDRNVWGVTFAADDDTFYATVATGGTPYLVRGDLGARTLTAVRSPAECPSLSPDGTRVAYKVDTDPGRAVHWTPAVLDLATGQQTLLSGERTGIDDQVEWLDDDTLLYGLPTPGQTGVTDVWAIGTTATARPRMFLEKAWSPSVVR